jgi:hypothetical protein
MSLIDGFVGVDATSVEINLDRFSVGAVVSSHVSSASSFEVVFFVLQVKAENFMKVPTAYSTAILNDILRRLYNERKEAVNYEANEILEDWTRDAFEGMSAQTLVELLEYLSRKIVLAPNTMETDHV